MKLKQRKSTMVQPPSVADSPATLECKLIKKIILKGKKNNQNIMIIGEGIVIHIKDTFKFILRYTTSRFKISLHCQSITIVKKTTIQWIL